MVRSLSRFSETDVCPVLLLSFDRERKSGRPLLVSLALELLSRNLRRTPSNSFALERQEYARRDRDLFWYLFRGSIWESWTRYDVHRCHCVSVVLKFTFITPSWNPLPKPVSAGQY